MLNCHWGQRRQADEHISTFRLFTIFRKINDIDNHYVCHCSLCPFKLVRECQMFRPPNVNRIEQTSASFLLRSKSLLNPKSQLSHSLFSNCFLFYFFSYLLISFKLCTRIGCAIHTRSYIDNKLDFSLSRQMCAVCQLEIYSMHDIFLIVILEIVDCLSVALYSYARVCVC